MLRDLFEPAGAGIHLSSCIQAVQAVITIISHKAMGPRPRRIKTTPSFTSTFCSAADHFRNQCVHGSHHGALNICCLTVSGATNLFSLSAADNLKRPTPPSPVLHRTAIRSYVRALSDLRRSPPPPFPPSSTTTSPIRHILTRPSITTPSYPSLYSLTTKPRSRRSAFQLPPSTNAQQRHALSVYAMHKT